MSWAATSPQRYRKSKGCQNGGINKHHFAPIILTTCRFSFEQEDREVREAELCKQGPGGRGSECAGATLCGLRDLVVHDDAFGDGGRYAGSGWNRKSAKFAKQRCVRTVMEERNVSVRGQLFADFATLLFKKTRSEMVGGMPVRFGTGRVRSSRRGGVQKVPEETELSVSGFFCVFWGMAPCLAVRQSTIIIYISSIESFERLHKSLLQR
jgi:hypothetical protein